jgi:hypothetical protein
MIQLKTKDEIAKEIQERKKRLQENVKEFFMKVSDFQEGDSSILLRKLSGSRNELCKEKPEEYRKIYDLYLAKLTIKDITNDPLYYNISKEIDLHININIVVKNGTTIYSIEDTLIKYINTILRLKPDETEEAVIDFNLITISAAKILGSTELAQYLFGILGAIACKKSRALSLQAINFINELLSNIQKIKYEYSLSGYYELLAHILNFYKAVFLCNLSEYSSALMLLEPIKHNRNIHVNENYFLSGSSGRPVQSFYKEIYKKRFG